MEADYRALLNLAQTYFDAAYEMSADRFASIFYETSSVTKVADDGGVVVTPIETWLAVVRSVKSPKQAGLERHQLSDEILSIDVAKDLAMVKLRFQTGSRRFTDMLSCLRAQGSWKIAQKVMTSEPVG